MTFPSELEEQYFIKLPFTAKYALYEDDICNIWIKS